MSGPLVASHNETLSHAIDAIAAREHWSAYEEHPKAYGEGAAAEAEAGLKELLGKRFPLDQEASAGWAGGER
jgi:hypothetical protein